MGHLLYLATLIVFPGAALTVIGLRYRGELRTRLRPTALFAVLAVPLPALTDTFALKLGAWAYNPAHTLNVMLGGTAVETYAFTGVVAFCIFLSVLIWADRQDKRDEDQGKGVSAWLK